MSSEEARQEASIPTAARINLVTLAELAKWWEDNGRRIRTMSQLISWSMDLVRDVLRTNGKIVEVEMSIADANNYLSEKGLYQRSVRERGIKKIATALRFESLREEGVNPKDYVPQQYNIVHNKQSVQPLEGKVEVGYVSPYEDDYTKAKLANQQAAYEERKRKTAEAIARAKVEGRIAEESLKPGMGIREGMSAAELDEYDRAREIEVRAKENAPVDVEWLKKNVVKG
jgi:hypothetical protein